MDAGRLERADGRDEEYRSLTRATFSWDVLWRCKHVTAHRALAWGRAGTCIYVYIHRYLPGRTCVARSKKTTCAKAALPRPAPSPQGPVFVTGMEALLIL
jgi:hypothetical protein